MDDKKKQQDSKVKSYFEKVKKADMKKKSRIVIVFFFLIALIFGTIANLGFAPFDFLTWLADMLILLGIEVFGLLMGEISGMDRYHENVNGAFQRNLALYNKQMGESGHLVYQGFGQWYSRKLPEELISKKVDFLTSKGISYDNAYLIVHYCDLGDIDALSRNVIKKEDKKTKKDVYIDQIKPYQVEAVKHVLGGDFQLDAPNSSYYLTAISDKHNGLSIFELGNAYQKDIKQTKNVNRAVKLGASVVISAFMAALTVYDLMGGDSLQAWMKLISRITALCTSLFSGFLSAKAMVSIESKIIKNKVICLGMYLTDVKTGVFMPKNKEEIVKEKYEEQVKKEKEAADKVITPEVLEEKNVKKLENKSRQISMH